MADEKKQFENLTGVWYDEFADLDPDTVSVSISACSVNNNSIFSISGGVGSTLNTIYSGNVITGSISSGGFSTISLGSNSDEAKPGQVLVMGEDGNARWEDPFSIIDKELSENPALEGAFEELLSAWDRFKMMRKLCLEKPEQDKD